MMKARLSTARCATPGDVVNARRAFWQKYRLHGSGWFKDDQTCEDFFDDMAEDKAFSVAWLKRMAKLAE